jgi:hypothetical protein
VASRGIAPGLRGGECQWRGWGWWRGTQRKGRNPLAQLLLVEADASAVLPVAALLGFHGAQALPQWRQPQSHREMALSLRLLEELHIPARVASAVGLLLCCLAEHAAKRSVAFPKLLNHIPML